MGMPVVVEVVDKSVAKDDLDKVFSYFNYVDGKFSTYKPESEISKINSALLKPESASKDTRDVFALSEQTKQLTGGYFNIVTPRGNYDPSGLVKGWAISNAAKILLAAKFKNFYVEAGGDIQTFGYNRRNQKWSVGIKNPFNQSQIVKVVYLSGQGIATSGTYIRGQHIYNPHHPGAAIKSIASLTVIGPNVYEADRFATAAFAMEKEGISFIQSLKGLEGYMIDKDGVATMTSGFEVFTHKNKASSLHFVQCRP